MVDKTSVVIIALALSLSVAFPKTPIAETIPSSTSDPSMDRNSTTSDMNKTLMAPNSDSGLNETTTDGTLTTESTDFTTTEPIMTTERVSSGASSVKAAPLELTQLKDIHLAAQTLAVNPYLTMNFIQDVARALKSLVMNTNKRMKTGKKIKVNPILMRKIAKTKYVRYPETLFDTDSE